MCLAQGPQRSDAGEALTPALRSRVKHSTTEPLRFPLLVSSSSSSGSSSSSSSRRSFGYSSRKKMVVIEVVVVEVEVAVYQ